MESQQIIAALREATSVPAEAVREATSRRDEMVPVLIGVVARSADAPMPALAGEDGLVFLAVHLLGSWRATPAYRAVADLLARDVERLDMLLGDAVAFTIHRVMFNLFDGDPAPLMDLIENPAADCQVRRRMLDTMGMLTVAGRIERPAMADYLRRLEGNLAGDPNGLVSSGWAELIAQLGFSDLRGAVEQSFCAGIIDPQFLSHEDFERMLADAQAGEVMAGIGDEYRPFGDIVSELRGWTIRDDPESEADREDIDQEDIEEEVVRIAESLRQREPALAGWDAPGSPAMAFPGMPSIGLGGQQTVLNPYRYVGRNDPCPCGSGRKFKRCCGQWK
ncbi:DUF1186 domain-containing protein [Skermanella rosea]|uniref:DUF1186 domain-containing protein n=1 Tax=Skermanella rosea TaxID=1817965 RepID=UPI001E29A6C1|nr:DUF1186 domain-containing protein [Skermanella rosea]UEM02025.1 DUF1186 domain-containing protein [Skermanella rosea]